MIEIDMSLIRSSFSYSSHEKYICSGGLQSVKILWNPTSPIANDKFEFFLIDISFVFKLPATFDMTHAIFNSSLKCTIEHLSGNYHDKPFAEFIIFFIQQLLVKRMRRCVYFRTDSTDHKNKFKSPILAADIVKFVI